MSILAVLGYVRGFLQVTYTLTIVEDFESCFGSVFTLLLFIVGSTGLFVGSIASKLRWYILFISIEW